MASARRGNLFLVLGLSATALVLGSAITPSAASAVAGARTFTLYTAPLQQAFINNNDDRSRGDLNNPFGTHQTNPSTVAGEGANGPYPGDITIFSLNIYSNVNRTTKTGTAVYTCQYYFSKNAFCNASFQIGPSGLISAGSFNFSAKTFALAVTGGYGTFIDLSGDVEAFPSGTQAQRLVFTLQ